MCSDAFRLRGRLQARDRVGRDDDAPAAVELVDIDDTTGDRDWPNAPLQHRRAVLPARLLHPGKPGGGECERNRPRAPGRPAPQGGDEECGGGE